MIFFLNGSPLLKMTFHVCPYKGIGIDWGVFYPSVNHQGQGNRNNAISTVENSNVALASIRIRSEQLLQTETDSSCM